MECRGHSKGNSYPLGEFKFVGRERTELDLWGPYGGRRGENKINRGGGPYFGDFFCSSEHRTPCTLELLSQVYIVLFNTWDFRVEISPPSLVDSECHSRGVHCYFSRAVLRGSQAFWPLIGANWVQKKEYTLLEEEAIVKAEFRAFEGPIYKVIVEYFQGFARHSLSELHTFHISS